MSRVQVTQDGYAGIKRTQQQAASMARSQTQLGASTIASAYRSAAFSLPTGWNKIPLDTVDFDAAGCFDVVTNHRYNVSATGSYHVDGHFQIALVSTNQLFEIGVYVNGTLRRHGQTVQSGTAGANTSLVLGANIQCSTGDYIELWSNNGAVSAGAMTTLGAGGNYLAIVRVA